MESVSSEILCSVFLCCFFGSHACWSVFGIFCETARMTMSHPPLCKNKLVELSAECQILHVSTCLNAKFSHVSILD